MERQIMPENRPESVPYIVHEAEMARQERHIKRLLIAYVITVIAIVGGFLWYLNQYDFTSYEQDGQGVNIIGNGNGVDYDGPASEIAHQEEPFNGERQSYPQAS